MTTETALALPDEQTFKSQLQAIAKFQQVAKANMIEGHDFGVIPGTDKPTLLKPGAEKIAKLLGLADYYEITNKTEDWNKPFFHYEVKCRLVHIASGVTISEGLGSCNSWESKYKYRWVNERDLSEGTDKKNLVSAVRHSKTGGHWTVYRFENEDIFSQVNTLLKMAKKRALVDASLSAGRLSDVFTQDIEDISDSIEKGEPEKTEDKAKHWCAKHNVKFFKTEKMKGYAHPIEGTKEWCNESETEKPKEEQPVVDTKPLFEAIRKYGKTEADMIALCKELGYPARAKELTKEQIDNLIKKIETVKT